MEEFFIDELRGWKTVNNGEITKIEEQRKNTSSIPGKTVMIAMQKSARDSQIVMGCNTANTVKMIS